jgi:uncharacterized repeat protein (TIGR04076 family)
MINVRHIVNFSKSNLKKHTCKYYRSMLEEFGLNSLGPEGICLDLYYAAYPYCLALLYGAKFTWENDKNAVNAQCPAPAGNVHFQVMRKPLKKQIISNGIKKKCRIIIKITHIEKSVLKCKNGCDCKLMAGQKFEFNQGDDLNQMCPAAFYNIYPNIKTFMNSKKASWMKDGKIFMQCPDNISGIMFEITKNDL